MLKLIWTPTRVTLPDSYDWARTADSLAGDDGPLQAFPRPAAYGAAPEPASAALAQALDAWIAGKAKVTVMVHGYDFDPSGQVGGAEDDPFRLVYGRPPEVDYHNSWLPLVGECDEDGTEKADIALAFAWVSMASFLQYGDAGWSNSYQYAVFDLAPLAARALATVLGHLCARGVTVDILAHSLGTRTVSQAIGHLPPGTGDATIRRVVLLGGAEFCVDAARNLTDRGFEIFNIASRADEVLSIGGQQMCHPVRANGSDAARVIGRDGLAASATWLDMEIDWQKPRGWLAGHTPPYAVTPDPGPDDVHAFAGLGHWVYYTVDGNRKLVADLMQNEALTIASFTQAGFPGGIDADYYGRFDPAIPDTPMNAAGRPGTNPAEGGKI